MSRMATVTARDPAALPADDPQHLAARVVSRMQALDVERAARHLLGEISARLGWVAARMELLLAGGRTVIWHVEPGGDLRALTAEASSRRGRRPGAPEAAPGPFDLRILLDHQLVACVEGVISTPAPPDAAERRVVDEICRQAGPALARRMAAAPVSSTDTDFLTGLEGRAAFVHRLHKASERARKSPKIAVALMLLDVDRFKSINESYGHDAGDELLRQLARRLEETVKPAGVPARIGGNEFAVLFERVHDPGAAVRAAERVQQALREPFAIGGREVYVTAAMGLAFAAESHAGSDDLLRDADTAAQRARSSGAGGSVVFDRAMHDAEVGQLTLENALRDALRRNELLAHFQPIVSLSSGRTVGFEALARWHHPVLGWVPPVRFIPAAERAGLIGHVGMVILRSACSGMRALEMSARRPLTLSVNLSAMQLLDPGLLDQVTRALSDAAMDPAQLRLEVTESVLVRQFEPAAAALEGLRRLKVRISMDDFGTGYSSISYLHRLPIDVLKIDRSFITALGESDKASGIIAAIVTLAKNLGLDLIAEGVETEAQESALRRLGCEHAQGYRFARPMPVGEACALLGKD